MKILPVSGKSVAQRLSLALGDRSLCNALGGLGQDLLHQRDVGLVAAQQIILLASPQLENRDLEPSRLLDRSGQRLQLMRGPAKRTLQSAVLVEPVDPPCLDKLLEARQIIGGQRSNLGRGALRGLVETREPGGLDLQGTRFAPHLGNRIEISGCEKRRLSRADGAEMSFDAEGIRLTCAVDGVQTLVVRTQACQCELIVKDDSEKDQDHQTESQPDLLTDTQSARESAHPASRARHGRSIPRLSIDRTPAYPNPAKPEPNKRRRKLCSLALRSHDAVDAHRQECDAWAIERMLRRDSDPEGRSNSPCRTRATPSAKASSDIFAV